MTRTISGALADATFSFACDAADLCDYARIHLGPLVRPAASRPAVSALLHWHDGQPPAQRPPMAAAQRVDRIDRDLYLSGHTLHWFRVDDLRDLHLQFTWAEDHLAVRGDFYHRLGNRPRTDRLRRLAAWPRRAALRRRRFTTLLYYLVYYPCWWWLEQVRDLHPIHAGGVCTDAGAILLAGASGVGKSSLTVALAASPRARLLADSFVMHRGAEAWGVREPVLLDDWGRRWSGAPPDLLRPIDWRYGLERRGYLLAPDRLAECARAALLLLPRRSSRSYVAPVAPEQAHRRLSALNLTINDLRRYFAFAAVIEQLVPRGLMAQRENQLASLTATVPAYEVGLTAEMSSSEAVEMILRLARESQQRMAGARARA
jgi:hypothetical protein